MASPLGLGFNQNNFRRNKANYRYDKVGKKWDKSTSSNYEESLFSSESSLSYFPESKNPDNGYNKEREIVGNKQTPHGGEMGIRTVGDSIYDVRTESIISWSESQGVGIKPNPLLLSAKDFAYLRNLGVYPNNRLIVCRKFGSGVNSDLSTETRKPVSTLISWRIPGEEFVTIDFGEEWAPAEASFTEILNDMGKDFQTGKENDKANIGEMLSGGLGGVSLPGFTEVFQRKLMEKLGLLDGKGADIIPSGNPNLITMAQQRKTFANGKADSGLTYKISVPVKIEYEQKFIGGVDPTKAFYDILSNVAQFGTQDAVFFLNGIGDKSKDFIDFLNKLRDNPRGAIEDLLKEVVNSLKKVVSDIKDGLSKIFNGSDDSEKSPEEIKKAKEDAEKKETSLAADLANAALDAILSVLSATVKKYEARIKGVVDALTGDASGPWHVTIGNPKRPIFTSGDMITKNVKITLGETLAFNDLPSRITVDFTLENARPLGLSEIMSRFMQAQGRTYIPGPSSWFETNQGVDYDISNLNENITPGGTPSSQIGGVPISDTQSDATPNIGTTQSNQSFSNGSGQESTSDKEVDPNSVRNLGTLTEDNSNIKDPSTEIYRTPGDPYEYKVVNGVWYTKGSRKDGTGNIPEWKSLEDNKKATDILNKRHPGATD